VAAVRRVAQVIGRRPAETAAPGIYAALTGVLVAFGVSSTKAAAIAGLVGVIVPMVVTYFSAKGG
jgi:hypothetical protein